MSQEMAPTLLLALIDDRTERAPPSPGQNSKLSGRVTQTKLDGRDVSLCPFAIDDGCGHVCGFVVDAEAGGWAGSREPVYADPGQDLVVGPGVVVGPVMELLIYPCEQTNGAVCDRVTWGLWLGGLDGAVARAFFDEPLAAL